MRLPDGLRRLAYRLSGREPTIEDERLFALFRNRAELRKELNALDDDRHRLLDRLKLQEGATMRVEEQMAALEQYLGRADEGYKSLAYYQLKTLWRAACKRLEQFGAELARQQKDRERKQQLADVERDKRARAAMFDRELVEARVLAEQLLAEQKLARQKLAQLQGFWNYFRRRSLLDAVQARDLRIAAANDQIERLDASVQAIQSEPPPLFEGLSVDGRRAINLAVIAYAELLHDRLAAGSLAELARQSTLKRVFDAHYGTPQECQILLHEAAEAVGEVERMGEDLAEIKARADRLRRSVAYRNDEETVPLPDSLSSTDEPAPPGARRTANVLLDEYWEIHRALAR